MLIGITQKEQHAHMSQKDITEILLKVVLNTINPTTLIKRQNVIKCQCCLCCRLSQRLW